VVEGVKSLLAFDLELEALSEADVRDVNNPGRGLLPEESQAAGTAHR
jgi:hypothetical protein